MLEIENDHEYDRKKLIELVLYVGKKSLGDRSFGATKLNKLLFFCDFAAYGSLGKPITGASYRRQDHGPVPAELRGVVNDLEETGDALVIQPRYYNYTQRRLIPRREPDLSLFTGEEIALVDDVLEQGRPYDATTISDVSHQFPGWQLAEDGEDIPYSSVFLSTEPPNSADIARAQELAVTHGW